ncbi:hypothetical protein CC1G_01333 [Coprinopsis cinerea okayama7|uniref:Uncharacterized protein n=1 Tax=Coprinopsis cinerea (strain Okayama-7 / 130 / ATCC MYA-4618 / FGSC 9003) TaxID=240176 RepID=A8NYG4_COPC7|nr:hypothetical protein CC1G_01333 [Coprinopsis cinerea okayama7\|eukprot:XP_001837421.1 hypothetical protein CC1G_01333 [Coprinopsis cinerea okayama7\
MGDAWAAYQIAVEGKYRALKKSDYLAGFAINMLQALEVSAMNKGKISASAVEQWGKRLQTVFDRLDSMRPPRNVEATRLAKARLQAVLGDNSALLSLLRQRRAAARTEGVEGKEGQGRAIDDETWSLWAWSLHRYLDSQKQARALEDLSQENYHATLELLRCPLETLQEVRRAVRQGISIAATGIKDPVARYNCSHPPHRPLLLDLLLCGLMDAESLKTATALVDQVRQQHSAYASPGLVKVLAMKLIQSREFDLAKTALLCLPKDDSAHPDLSLFLASAMGDPMAAQRIYRESFSERHDPRAQTHLLRAYLNAEDAPATLGAFNRLFPKNESGQRTNNPQPEHYSVVFSALTRHDHGNGMERWIDDMKVSGGFRLSDEPHGLVVEYYANRDMVEDLVSLFTEIDERRVRGERAGTVSVFTSAMGYFARRRDPVTVEALYKRMIQSGIEPTVHTFTALMNAHVEAGTWTGVLKTFKHIRDHYPYTRFDINIFNILFKAYIHLGAPFGFIEEQVWRLETLDIKLNEYTYALYLEAACDLGNLDNVRRFYRQSLRKQRSDPSAKILSPHFFNIAIAAFNAWGMTKEAISVYDDMLAFGFEPTSHTYGSVVRGLVQKHHFGGAPAAEDFIKKLIDQSDGFWKSHPDGQGTWYEHLYAPLFHVYSRTSLKDAERLYRSIVQSGEKPTLLLLTFLMSSYSKAGDLEGVLGIWPEILQHGVRQINVAAPLRDVETVSASQNAPDPCLCIALSIYIDSCASRGLHSKVAEAWRDYQQHHLKLDHINWTSLTLAMIRAGDPVRAFEIVQNINIANQRAAHEFDFEMNNPNTPLLYDAPVPTSPGQVDPRTSTHLFRRSLWDSPSRRIVMRRAFIGPPRYEHAEKDRHLMQLERLIKKAPTWNVWRPHWTVLRSLLRVVNKLEEGYCIRPSTRTDQGIVMVESEPDVPRAHAMLNAIMTKYPEAFEAVMDFREKEMAKFGELKFGKMYKRILK